MLIFIVNLFLTPINAIFNIIFPDLSGYISTFNTMVDTYLGTAIGFFSHMFPPTFLSLLVLWLTFVGAYYGIRFTYNTSIKIFNLIQKLKFW